MKGALIFVGILVVIFFLVAMPFIGTYNNLVQRRNDVDAKWAQVENVYQRRLDLIPNLVGAVKGAMTQEQKIFTAIAEARTRYNKASNPGDKAAAASQVESQLAILINVIHENYPQLESISTVKELMAELSGTENRIAVERKVYNEVTKTYNNAVQTFPGVLVAKVAGFEPRPFFKADEGAAKAPKVNLP